MFAGGLGGEIVDAKQSTQSHHRRTVRVARGPARPDGGEGGPLFSRLTGDQGKDVARPLTLVDPSGTWPAMAFRERERR